MGQPEPHGARDGGGERLLLLDRHAHDGRAARARPRRALLPHLRAGDLGAGGRGHRDPARPRLHTLAPLRAARLPVLGMVPDPHGLHALRGRRRRDPPRLHGRGHGLRDDLHRGPHGHRLRGPGRARALGRRPPPPRRIRAPRRHEGGRAGLDARLRLGRRRIGPHGARGAGRRRAGGAPDPARTAVTGS